MRQLPTTSVDDLFFGVFLGDLEEGGCPRRLLDVVGLLEVKGGVVEGRRRWDSKKRPGDLSLDETEARQLQGPLTEGQAHGGVARQSDVRL